MTPLASSEISRMLLTPSIFSILQMISTSSLTVRLEDGLEVAHVLRAAGKGGGDEINAPVRPNSISSRSLSETNFMFSLMPVR